MELKPVDSDHLKNWRQDYQAGLGIPVIPEFHDALCRLGQAYLVEEVGKTLGYVIFAQTTFIPGWTPVIPEFYLGLEQTKFVRQILQRILEKLRPHTIIGRTDDRMGFPVLMDLKIPNQVSSPLYILEKAPFWMENRNLAIRQSGIEDALDLLPIYSSLSAEDGGFPDAAALTKSLAIWRHYKLMNGREVIAVAYVVPQGRNYVTVNPIIVEGARGKGLGRYLTAYAIRRELSEGKVCVATMSPDNQAGRNLMESLGSRLAAHFVYFRP
ncbi:GNAT family N-acetyltransferase [bacterium]|nr:GNAT family N-acetyltransferase [bacterium]